MREVQNSIQINHRVPSPLGEKVRMRGRLLVSPSPSGQSHLNRTDVPQKAITSYVFHE